jgi:N-acetylglutamate synthase-like GNAT family acetyltransferase
VFQQIYYSSPPLSNVGIISIMRVRKARKTDLPQVLKLARACNLDYSGMATDDFWVAEESGKIRGICGLKKHRDCLELCSLGVDEKYRRHGLGRLLVLTLLRCISGEIYLATVIPGFFEPFGFRKAGHIPGSMIKKEEWCAGCNREQCLIMIRTEG